MGEIMRLRHLFALALALTAVSAVTLMAAAETKWPTRPVRFILTLGAGSGSDIGARLLADRLTQRWGQPVIVENRPGGDAIVAINAFVSAHDDHVLLFAPSSSFTAHPFLHDNLPYQPSDLVPITRVSNTIITISVPASLNVNSLKELAAMARAEPGKLNWAGVTGALDFVFAGWLKQEGLNINKVPYKNPVDAANDLAEGRVQVYEAALAIDGLVGLFGPPGMPLELRERITADIRAVADSTIAERLTITGQLMNIGGPDEFGRSIEEQRATVAAFARDLGIKPMQ